MNSTPTLENVSKMGQRRSIRLPDYDYSQDGAYFITVCVQGRVSLFGEIVDVGMRLNDAGRAVQQAWLALPGRFPGIRLDQFVVMPNHVHGIIIEGVEDSVGAPLVGARSSTPAIPDDRKWATTRVAPTPNSATGAQPEDYEAQQFNVPGVGAPLVGARSFTPAAPDDRKWATTRVAPYAELGNGRSA